MQKNRIFSITSIIICLLIFIGLFYVSENYFKIPSVVFILLFFASLFIITLIYQKKTKKTGYINPYVDTKKYKFPIKLNDLSKLPEIDYTRFIPEKDEKLIFVCETTQKQNEGVLIITNKKVLIQNLNEKSSFFTNEIKIVERISTCAIRIATEKEKFYVIVNQPDVDISIKILNLFLK